MKRRCVFNILVRAEAIAAMAPLRAGYDMLREIGNEDEDLVVVHDALGFGGCHLAVAVPNGWEEVNSLDDLLSAGHVPSVARVIVYSCMLPCSLFHRIPCDTLENFEENQLKFHFPFFCNRD